MATLIYTNGGDNYIGTVTNNTINEWLHYGKEANQKYMYKGYRYFDNKKDIVIVYDNKQWYAGELAKRKANGFLGIREYTIT